MDLREDWFAMLGRTIPKESLSAFLQSNPQLIAYTAALSTQNHQPQSWRAAWLTKLTCKKNDPQILPYVDRLIEAIDEKHDGHQRELMNILLKMSWNEAQEGLLFEKCLEICGSIGKSPSVRIVAFRVLCRLITKYPELWYEIQFIVVEDYLETLTAGVKNGFKKELHALQKAVLPKL